MAGLRRITHVIFDMDGLLLDTEKFYTEVQAKILARFGKPFSWDLKAKMMGKKAMEAAQVLVEEMQLEGQLTPEEFLHEREAMLGDLFPNSETMPGAERLIRHLHAHNIPMCIATSSHKTFFEMKSQKHAELFSLMRHVVVGDDPAVAKGKPAPDIFLAAASRFQERPTADTCLVLEDAPSGVQAARAAGMGVVMVPDPELDRQLCQEADQIISSLNDFDPTHWGLPTFTQ
eukprot:jgi/Mesen1/1361/ME000013S00853